MKRIYLTITLLNNKFQQQRNNNKQNLLIVRLLVIHQKSHKMALKLMNKEADKIKWLVRGTGNNNYGHNQLGHGLAYP